MVLCASMVTDEPVHIANCPLTSDIKTLLQLLEGLGIQVACGDDGCVILHTSHVRPEFMNTSKYDGLFSAVRVSVNIIGPLLARIGHIRFPLPGGDRIGGRKIDTLLNGLATLGHCIERHHDGTWGITRARPSNQQIVLEEASITGTASCVMAATGVVGHVEVLHTAFEPDVDNLCHMLREMGAQIVGNRDVIAHGR